MSCFINICKCGFQKYAFVSRYIGMKIVLALFMIISGAPFRLVDNIYSVDIIRQFNIYSFASFSGENNRCNDKCQNKAAAWLYYGGYVLLVAMGM